MLLKKWEDLPSYMKCDEVRTYYDILSSKKYSLILKRIFDVLVASVLLVILAIPMIIIAVMIKLDSLGPVFYRQERVTTYGKHFKIHKFRTMVSNADKIGTAVTVENDNRITRVGAKLRGLRLDELPQVLDVLSGNMSFVGTRPETVKYVDKYKPEYMATLLLPAGITSEASIRYKDEATLRPCHTYGPGITSTDSRANVQFIRNVLNGEDIVMKSAGTQMRSYNYIGDCASAIITVLINGESGQAYNIANPDVRITIAQLAKMIAIAAKRKVVFSDPDIIDIANRTPIVKQVLSTKKIEDLGWKGAFTAESGIRHTLDILQGK